MGKAWHATSSFLGLDLLLRATMCVYAMWSPDADFALMLRDAEALPSRQRDGDEAGFNPINRLVSHTALHQLGAKKCLYSEGSKRCSSFRQLVPDAFADPPRA
ncbi:hypothetical protein B0T26DRAFT_680867 [Lasiosphaeria miniovina]|uniref:Uncharacterized protein n=1 Tax=Lasiosphaeria miniovina TaxID=1954250 RepID=A0AA40DHB7_9PEZI|nr:uncharacterized protein B0T26DRAFT_680867 [Lasiosphaeria miniovina]KAK0703130.1 hypothetical protein B0T26DRAFT_680867 [Lasiosphaeria miniovina]